MKVTQTLADKVSVGLSLACVIHCLLAPLLLVLLPSLSALQLDNESFHIWMLVAVIPISVYALTLGCKKHKRYRLLVIGCAGLALLIAAVFLGERIAGEYGEKILTVLGACIVAVGHILNFGLCQQSSCSKNSQC